MENMMSEFEELGEKEDYQEVCLRHCPSSVDYVVLTSCFGAKLLFEFRRLIM
jgi:hypothetical protein